jgi:arylsulfatase A-like enzyme
MLFFSNTPKRMLQNLLPETTTIAPNIVFLIADDTDQYVFGNNPEINSTETPAPTLDSWAGTGINVPDFWTNTAFSRKRTAILTGNNSFCMGIGIVPSPSAVIVPRNEIFILKYI